MFVMQGKRLFLIFLFGDCLLAMDLFIYSVLCDVILPGLPTLDLTRHTSVSSNIKDPGLRAFGYYEGITLLRNRNGPFTQSTS